MLERKAHTVNEPRTVLVGERANDFRQSVEIVFKTLEPSKLRIDREGVVTAVGLQVGSYVSPGTNVLAVDGQPIASYTGESPLYRPLQAGDEGPDVGVLLRLLEETGHAVDELALEQNPTFGPRVVERVLEMQRSIGHVENALIDPSNFVFVPVNFTRVARVMASVGDPVPGEKIVAISDPVATSFEIRRSDSDASSLRLSSESITIFAGENSYALDGTDEDPPDIKGLFETLLGWSREGVISLEEENTTFVFRGLMVRATNVARFGLIPNTAVFVDPEGNACLLVRKRSGVETLRTVDISEAVGEIGVTAVEPAVIGIEVMANVSDSVDPDQICP
ncbi:MULTISPECIES: hypothetical protein [unclassified Leucobacter]|uniref:hypothetical protein n=1 Tax=unclassified Leucobacter TaxID=2621730 RepID=UPI00165E2882|nr:MULTISPECIES: hypothetical protein [unclassified Leucobacter]